MTLRNALLAAACGLCLASGPAQAAIISGTWAFSASGFSNGFGPFSGSFTFSFDNSADVIESTALTVNSLSPNPFGQVGFTYFKEFDTLIIGGLVTGVTGITFSTTDFQGIFVDVSTAPVAFEMRVSNNGDRLFSPTSFTGSFTPSQLAVPEPASLALLGAGLLGLGFARRRRAPGAA